MSDEKTIRDTRVARGVKELALHQGPEQYLALDELARRLRENPPSWWTPGENWIWSPLDITRAPNAIEVEWALLKCSQQYNEGTGSQGVDYGLIREQEKRLKELEEQLDQIEDSLEIRYFNCLQKYIAKAENEMR